MHLLFYWIVPILLRNQFLWHCYYLGLNTIHYISKYFLYTAIAQSAGAVEYTDWTSAEG